MASDLKEIIKLIFQAIYIILLIYIGWQVLRAIFGGTWATENIIIAGMGIILVWMFSVSSKLGKLEGMFDGIKEKIRYLEHKIK